MFANCLKNNHVNSLYYIYVLVLILHVPYGNHRKMLGLTCLTLFVPGFFHVDMTGGALIGRTPQKLCRLTAIIR
jgi:hypothetical protein